MICGAKASRIMKTQDSGQTMTAGPALRPKDISENVILGAGVQTT